MGQLLSPEGSSIHKAHWVPDAEASVCQHPQCETSFALTMRRHHCRACGGVFCRKHCRRRLPLSPLATLVPADAVFIDASGGRCCTRCRKKIKGEGHHLCHSGEPVEIRTFRVCDLCYEAASKLCPLCEETSVLRMAKRSTAGDSSAVQWQCRRVLTRFCPISGQPHSDPCAGCGSSTRENHECSVLGLFHSCIAFPLPPTKEGRAIPSPTLSAISNDASSDHSASRPSPATPTIPQSPLKTGAVHGATIPLGNGPGGVIGSDLRRHSPSGTNKRGFSSPPPYRPRPGRLQRPASNDHLPDSPVSPLPLPPPEYPEIQPLTSTTTSSGRRYSSSSIRKFNLLDIQFSEARRELRRLYVPMRPKISEQLKQLDTMSECLVEMEKLHASTGMEEYDKMLVDYHHLLNNELIRFYQTYQEILRIPLQQLRDSAGVQSLCESVSQAEARVKEQRTKAGSPGTMQNVVNSLLSDSTDYRVEGVCCDCIMPLSNHPFCPCTGVKHHQVQHKPNAYVWLGVPQDDGYDSDEATRDANWGGTTEGELHRSARDFRADVQLLFRRVEGGLDSKCSIM